MKRFDLVAFDVDGTLIVHPEGKTVWEVLNRAFTGSDDQNAERLKDYLAGRLSYAEWVALDVGSWQKHGARRDRMIASLDGLSLVKGAREALADLKGAGIRLAIISGTLDFLLETLFPDHPFDEVYTNHVHFDGEGRISGWAATPFDMEGKGVALRSIAAREGIALERVAFVGDSTNDLSAARIAGCTIALNPKSAELERVASAVVRTDDLRSILPYLLEG